MGQRRSGGPPEGNPPARCPTATPLVEGDRNEAAKPEKKSLQQKKLNERAPGPNQLNQRKANSMTNTTNKKTEKRHYYRVVYAANIGESVSDGARMRLFKDLDEAQAFAEQKREDGRFDYVEITKAETTFEIIL